MSGGVTLETNMGDITFELYWQHAPKVRPSPPTLLPSPLPSSRAPTHRLGASLSTPHNADPAKHPADRAHSLLLPPAVDSARVELQFNRVASDADRKDESGRGEGHG